MNLTLLHLVAAGAGEKSGAMRRDRHPLELIWDEQQIEQWAKRHAIQP
jgi:hypothetical protein